MKKTVSVLIALILMLTQGMICFAAPNLKGDIDADGIVSAADARLALRQAVGLEQLTPREIAAADMTGSGKITAEDARTILRIAVNLTSYEAEEEEAVEAMLASMTTQEKVEQMIMPQVRYFNGEPVEKLNDALRSMLQRHAFAGVIFFAQNTANAEQTLRLADAIQTANKADGRTQLLISVDQEGGKITRLATGTQTPGNMALGAIGDAAAAREAAGVIGEELSAIGINVDFAPVMDVNNNPSNPVIGVRSFSDDPDLAAELGAAYISGLQDHGVISALKHFPGHGDTGTDSHTGLPRIDKTYDELRQNELLPFASGIGEGTDMIMTAHIQFPAIEKQTYVSKKTGEEIELPATLSKTMVTDILRGDMGYNGVVITDAMNMDAIADHFAPLDAAAFAINAGVDILLMPANPDSEAGIASLDAYIDGVTALVNNGTISIATVNAAVRRILRMKYENGLFTEYENDTLEEDVVRAKATVGSNAHHEAEWRLAKKAITMVKNDGDVLPVQADGQKIVFLAAYSNEVLSMQYGVERLKDEGKFPATAKLLFDCYADTPIDTVLSEIEDADYVIAISELYRASALNPENSNGETYKNLDRIIETVHKNDGNFVLISANLPYDTARFQSADAILLCWSDKGMSEDPRVKGGDVTQYGPNIPAAVYLALSDEEGPEGTLPVNIPKLTADYTYSSEILYPFGYGLHYDNAEKAFPVSIREINKHGNLILETSFAEMNAAGFAVGDIITVTAGNAAYDLPVGTSYTDVDNGEMVCRFDLEDNEIALAINMGSFAAKTGVAEKITIDEAPGYRWDVHVPELRLTLKEKAGYLDEYNARNLTRTDNRADYESLTDEDFANFRAVSVSGLRANTLYRSSTPIDPSIGRNTYAMAAMEKAGIRAVVNLTDSAEKMTAYEAYPGSFYSKCAIATPEMSYDFTTAEFAEKVKESVLFIAENEGPYLIHCKEGKDRTGILCAILECFAGATAEEVKQDYMTTYVNFYGITPADAAYDIILHDNLVKTLCGLFGIDALESANLQEKAAAYLTGAGLSEAQLNALSAKLISE